MNSTWLPPYVAEAVLWVIAVLIAAVVGMVVVVFGFARGVWPKEQHRPRKAGSRVNVGDRVRIVLEGEVTDTPDVDGVRVIELRTGKRSRACVVPLPVLLAGDVYELPRKDA